jgi:hypothetical protein
MTCTIRRAIRRGDVGYAEVRRGGTRTFHISTRLTKICITSYVIMTLAVEGVKREPLFQ